MIRKLAIALLALAALAVLPAPALAAKCIAPGQEHCGGHVSSDPQTGQFHGVIAVHGNPQILSISAHGGTEPGCGDCTWTIILACPQNTPSNPAGQASCNGATNDPTCRRGVLERIYLSDDAVPYAYEGQFCLRGRHPVVPVGERAHHDVERYLKNVTPPPLTITTRPKDATLAGLATYFDAATPASLRPQPFGGRGIIETITIAPRRTDWTWGDGSATGWTAATVTPRHAYVHGGTDAGRLASRWGATYTIGYAGQTFGPYTATGTVTRVQGFVEHVRTSSPVLVSP